MKYFLFFIVFQFSIIFAQQNSNINFKWKPYSGNNIESNFDSAYDIFQKSNVEGFSSMQSYYEEASNSLNKNMDIYSRNYSSSWVKMPGPFGGSVRRFYEFNNELYAITSREVLLYEEHCWRSLNAGHLSSNMIYFIDKNDDNRLLLGTDSGLWFSDDEGEKWEQIELGSRITAYNIIRTLGGRTLLSTSNGVYISNADNSTFTLLALEGEYVYSVTIDNFSDIWASTKSGLIKANYNDLVWECVGLEVPHYSKIIIDSNNRVYTSSKNKALMSEDNGKSWQEMEFLQDADYLYIEDIVLDSEENLVVTTLFGKIFILNKDGLVWESPKFGEVFLTTLFNDNELLIGTLGSGAKKYKLDNDVYSDFSEGMNVSTIRALTTMANGDILTCTDSDSFYVSKDNGLTWESTYNYWTMSFENGNDGSVYVGAYNGILKSEDFGRTWEKLNVDVSSNSIRAIDISEDNNTIFVGTHEGEVYVSNSAGESFVKIKEANDISVDLIKVIDSETLLIKNGSLYYTNDGGRTLNEVEDIQTNMYTLTDCVVDNLGYIYLSSNAGVSRSLDGINWKLQTTDISGIMFLEIDKYNNIYAATSGGTVYYSNNHGEDWEIACERIPHTDFWSFTITSDGYILYGSQNRGLYRTKPENKNIEFNEVSITNNFPNPFNASTRIEYVVPKNSFVELEIYDLLGRKVKTLISEYKKIGEHFIYWHPENQASGVYFSRLKIGSKNKVNKMIYLK